MNDGGDSGSLSRVRERVRVRARELRTVPTDAEALLWFHLRDRRLGGFKFRRQRHIGPFFADFACLEAHLVVELDGGQHVERMQQDSDRTQLIEGKGFRVLRFWNNDMLQHTDQVLARILQACQDPHPNPLPQAGEGVRNDHPRPQTGEGNSQPGPSP